MNKLWLKISSAFFFLILMLAVILWFIIASIIQTYYKDQLDNQLIENTNLVAHFISYDNNYNNPEIIEEWLSSSDLPDDFRYTFLSPEGDVLADSHHLSENMENHADRPEVSAILNGDEFGRAERYSQTEETNMLYVAQSLYDNGELIGVVRTSMSLNILEETLKQFWRSFAFVFIILSLITVLAAALMTRIITQPIHNIIKVTKELREKNYSSRVNVSASGEIKELSNSINTLASSLYSQMKEIEENEEELISIMSNMVSGVMLVNQKGNVELINASMAKFLNLTPEFITGKPYIAIGEHTEMVKLIQTVFEDNKRVHDEIQAYIPDEHILDAHLAPYYGRGWRQRGVIIVLHDITNLKRLEQVRSDFVANVSHELKTPVTSVKGFAETLLSGEVRDEDTTRQFLQIIYDESERLDRLIRDLLQLSKIEKHELPLSNDIIHLVELMHNTAGTLQTSLKNRNITLTLPRFDQEIEFIGDEDRVKQIILNLIANAINYSQEGGKVDVTAFKTEQTVVFSVSDNGIGIPKENLPRIFERFYRVDKARSRHSGGTGLGLAIVKHLVESHKGTIEVESTEGVGTTFTVTLPNHK